MGIINYHGLSAWSTDRRCYHVFTNLWRPLYRT